MSPACAWACRAAERGGWGNRNPPERFRAEKRQRIRAPFLPGRIPPLGIFRKFFQLSLSRNRGNGVVVDGAYTLNGNTGIITKNVGATVWIPSENEWYKAAYYDPTPGAGGGDNYWTYATQSDSIPTVAAANATGDVANPGANVANYNRGADWNALNGNVTTVGSAAAPGSTTRASCAPRTASTSSRPSRTTTSGFASPVSLNRAQWSWRCCAARDSSAAERGESSL
jgi:hypothetical protein